MLLVGISSVRGVQRHKTDMMHELPDNDKLIVELPGELNVSCTGTLEKPSNDPETVIFNAAKHYEANSNLQHSNKVIDHSFAGGDKTCNLHLNLAKWGELSLDPLNIGIRYGR